MLSNLFGKKKPKTTKHVNEFTLFNSDGSVAFKGTPEQAIQALSYMEAHADLAQDFAELQATLADERDAKIDMLQKIDMLENENVSLGNAMFDIMKQVTPGANATVKRMEAIAKGAVFG